MTGQGPLQAEHLSEADLSIIDVNYSFLHHSASMSNYAQLMHVDRRDIIILILHIQHIIVMKYVLSRSQPI